MIVTINTDASYYHDHKVGGYAFWAVCNDWKLCKFGSLKEPCTHPTEAEIKSIVNAIHMVLKQGNNIDWIIINTDCLNAIHLFRNDHKEIQKFGLIRFNPFFKRIKGLIKRYESKIGRKIKVEFRHVKAHTTTATAKSWVNDWCDQKAKEGARKKILQITSGTGFLRTA
jgi:ribonuclease HI